MKNKQNTVPATVGRLVKRVGADTMLKNADRDHAQFAWIPMGDTCAFCMTLASRGWQYMSKDAMKHGHAEHIHANCDCQYAIRFDEKSTVEGYDPDRYREMYDNAEGGTPQEKINAMRREQYKLDGEKIRAQKRAAYAAQTETRVSVPDYYKDNFDDFSALTIPEEVQKSLSELRELSDENHFEYGQIVTESGKTDIFTSKQYGRIRIPYDEVDGTNLKVYHSHTNPTPLSAEDFQHLCNPRVSEIGNIASNRDVFIARVGNGRRPSEKEFLEAITRIAHEVDRDILDNPELYGLTDLSNVQELNYVAIREQAYRISREFEWELEGGRING